MQKVITCFARAVKMAFLVSFGMCCMLLGNAQENTITKDSTLRETRVKSSVKAYQHLQLDELSIGTYISTIDSGVLARTQHQSIAQLLTQKTPVFVKSYGVNGIATLTFRGASAAQSAVLWNGIPIMSPMSGISDISFMRAGLFDQVGILYGGSGALFGSGNIGGALLLQSFLPTFQPDYGANVSFNVGSFGRYDVMGAGFYQNKKWFISTKAYFHQSKNDFAYRDYANQTQQMENAKSLSYGAMFDAGLRIDSLQRLQISVWYQEANRQIPPALFESFSKKFQADRFLKTAIKWQIERKKHLVWANVSYGFDAFEFVDSLILMDNKAIAHQVFQEIGWRWQAHKNHTLYIFSPLQISWASGNNFNGNPLQIRPALVGNYRFSSPNQKISVLVSGRQEFWNDKPTPFLPSIGFDFFPTKFLKIQASAQRSYRVPTLNELYYFPGGNINLKPEKGWNLNAGIQFSHRIERKASVDFLHQVNGFARWIDNWIYWMGGTIWTPHNIAQVFSGGGEVNHRIGVNYKKWKWAVNLSGTYIVSISQKSDLPNDGSIGKQIPYTPRWNANAGFMVEWNAISLVYDHQFTGERFITVDESQAIPAYFTGNIHLSYTWRRKSIAATVGLEILNLWNEQYQIMWQRPMPGRYFMVNLKFGFRKS